MQIKDEEAIHAAADPQYTETFIAGNRQFILRCASKHTHKYITDSDDEWSVAMIAFSEAIHQYQADKGPFLPFAELVIRRRLTQYMRSEARFSGEIAVDPSAFQGQITDQTEDVALRKAVLQKLVDEDRTPLKDEIEAVNEILGRYHISFFDLARCSPKAEKTRKCCAAAVRHLLESPPLLSQVRRTSTLPVKMLCSQTGITAKILERHRKYIIASAEILDGDFPGLGEYLHNIRDN